MRDHKLLDEAKIELSDLAKQDKPFALTLMTMDTHGGVEYFDAKNCEAKFEERYKNTYHCSDSQIASFIRWIQSQDFYKDTLVVVVGDHLVMNDDIFEEVPEKERRVLNIFINSKTKPERAHHRQFSSFDIYPTIVEGLGAVVRGHRLALGASMFAAVPSLIERDYTPETLENEMSKRSKIYEHILYNR